eukprot:TRINITY_DN7321_c0_g1_i2.p1 TRINITY_DN7321_c0_g1~~TRINITY_DN7321_c0_g1_i2.p1  ORF type:complete len:349 (-),score=37.74 TRINITY_DN7321_c0_g1_i2:154-1200(-)
MPAKKRGYIESDDDEDCDTFQTQRPKTTFGSSVPSQFSSAADAMRDESSLAPSPPPSVAAASQASLDWMPTSPLARSPSVSALPPISLLAGTALARNSPAAAAAPAPPAAAPAPDMVASSSQQSQGEPSAKKKISKLEKKRLAEASRQRRSQLAAERADAIQKFRTDPRPPTVDEIMNGYAAAVPVAPGPPPRTLSRVLDELRQAYAGSSMTAFLVDVLALVEQLSRIEKHDVSAAQLVAAASPYSCVYGKVTAKNVIFIIDCSSSMAATWTANNGQQYTRMSFAQMELTEVISKQLVPFQNFNVLSFGGEVDFWMDDVVPATLDNVKSALQYIAKLQVCYLQWHNCS